MDHNTAEKIVRSNIAGYIRRFGLSHMTVTWEVGAIDDAGLGRCWVSDDYQRGLVRINNEVIDTEDRLLRTLRHELFHIVLSPIELLCDYADSIVAGDSLAGRNLKVVKVNACERQVQALERMYQAMNRKAR